MPIPSITSLKISSATKTFAAERWELVADLAASDGKRCTLPFGAGK